MAETSEKKLGVFSLAALVISAMIGGGIFSLPQNMAQDAAVMEVILAWVVTGIGMFFIANTFRILSAARPDASSGIYAYARLGFGRFGGFQMAWSYWLCSIFGNVGYAVLLMDALNYFFPGWFAGGNNLWSIIGGSCMIWIMNWAVLRGTRQAAVINNIGTVFKLVPLLLFVIVMLCVFRWKVFTTDMWGMENLPQEGLKPLGGVLPQVKSTMMVTLWAFIGIEGAVVVSSRAKDARSVGAATLIGFLGCLAIYALLSILPFGRLNQARLAVLENPSTAYRHCRRLGRRCDESRCHHRPADQLAGIHHHDCADSAGRRIGRHVPESVPLGKPERHAECVADCFQRHHAAGNDLRLFRQQCLGYHAVRNRRDDSAAVSGMYRVSLETLCAGAVSVWDAGAPRHGIVLRSRRHALCALDDLCRGSEISADGIYFSGDRHTGLYPGMSGTEPGKTRSGKTGGTVFQPV